jgi:hypothetical protein
VFNNIKFKINKNLRLVVVLYGCETRPLMLRKDPSLRVFEKNLARGIFAIKKKDVTGSG